MGAYQDETLDVKDHYKVSEGSPDSPDREIGVQDEWGNSQNDMRDMLRLGKKQESLRNFREFLCCQ